MEIFDRTSCLGLSVNAWFCRRPQVDMAFRRMLVDDGKTVAGGTVKPAIAWPGDAIPFIEGCQNTIVVLVPECG